MATYRVELRALYKDGHTVLTSSLGFTDFAYRRVLNGPGAFEGSIAIANAPATLTPGNRELLVYRDSTVVWGGYLDHVEVDVERKMLRVAGEGYWSRLRKRLVRGSQVFTNATVSDIAQALIAVNTGTQGLSNGDLGIRAGTHTGTTKTVNKRVYCGADLRFVGDIIEGFGEHGNLDFEVQPSPVASTRAALLNTWGPRRGTDKSATVVFTGSNTVSLDYAISASDLITTTLVYSTNECDMPWEPYSGNRNVATYGVHDAGLTVEERTVADATEASTEVLRIQSAPVWSARVSYLDGTGPALTAYDLGDKVALTPGDGYTTGSKTLNVMEQEVSVQAAGAMVGLLLEERQT